MTNAPDVLNGPDESEEILAASLDDVIPSAGYRLVPVVGIGGSAGSIASLQQFFSALPASPGMAFVVVLHLAADHESELASLLQGFTSLPVQQVRMSCKVQVDHVYVIPPGKALRAYDGVLQLAELPTRRHRHVAVDLFFRSLADTHGAHAAAVVLSGMDGDGAVGIKRIKERGGLTIAQDPLQAEHSGMPRAAMATGMIDWVLPAAEMAARLQRYFQVERQLRLPAEEIGDVEGMVAVNDSATEACFGEILAFLNSLTGRDLRHYKRATVLRRIARRMQVNGVSEMAAYLGCLRLMPGEAGALLKDLLISVTNFFRDPHCFAALEPELGNLIAAKSPGATLRVWTAACATGEEAYSLAILLAEYAAKITTRLKIQIFASDLDEEAIATARDALYPSAIEADVSEERLQRYFQRDGDGYRVRRDVREMVLFAAHDLLNDSPFSRLDLVTCRNLLIYLSRDAQTRVMESFAFALRPGGLLFLGNSESLDEHSAAFATINKKHRIFRRVDGSRFQAPALVGQGTLARTLHLQGNARPAALATDTLPRLRNEPGLDGGGGQRSAAWGRTHLQLLEQLAPPSVLVDADFNLLHLSQSAGDYLHYNVGEPSRNVLLVVKPELRVELQAALHQATHSGAIVRTPPVLLERENPQRSVSLRVAPVGADPTSYLVLFEPVEPAQDNQGTPQQPPVLPLDPAAREFGNEVERIKAQLRDTVEEYETSNEELKANNEELQAMNEELRSATEELETGREELQSINEELTTVNHELKSKVEELANSNGDMHNLMNATAIATVFMDRELRIKRFTPPATALFNLIPSDQGRPLSDLASNLDYAGLQADARQVIETLIPVEREVSRAGGEWFLVRMLPYRTFDDHIVGVVLTLVDITERKREQEALRLSQERFSVFVNQSSAGVVQISLEGRIAFANPSYQQLLGYSQSELAGMRLDKLVHPEDRQRNTELFARLAQTGEPFQIEKRCIRKDGAVIWTSNNISRLSGAAGQPATALAMCTDITERKQDQEALRTSEERLRLIVENATEFAIFSADPQMRVTRWSIGAERLLGYSEAEMMGRQADLIFTREDRATGQPELERGQALAQGRAADDRLHVRKDGSTFWASGVLMPMLSGGQAVGFVKILRDQSSERAAQHQLEDSRTRLEEALAEKAAAHAALEAADAAKDRFLAVLSHELRNPLASIQSATQVLGTKGLAPAETAQALGILGRQCKSMKKLMDDLLDVSRLSLGRFVLHRQPVRLLDVLQNAIDASKPQLDAAGHHFVLDVADENIVVNADPVRLSQVFWNLLTNAAKYTPPNGSIVLRACLHDGEARISVSDNGIGMAPDRVSAMFEMFVQEASDSIDAAGLGIGLALVRNIMDLHGGSVSGSSDGPGTGSVFTVCIPALQQQVEAAKPEAPPRPDGLGPCRVLVVDDNADIAWGISRLLQLSGCETEVALAGAAAIEAARREMPDVAVIDIGMPEVSGNDVARQLRALEQGRPLLLVAATGWGQEADRQRTADAGFDSHLTKPIDIETLRGLIDAFRRRGATPTVAATNESGSQQPGAAGCLGML
jgi:two-component system CheB/CheR fusion protein